MELRDLQIFVAVAEAGGFRRASQQLGLDASAVSRRVSMLEDELGVSLFERNRAGVRLTGAGRRFLTDTRLALSHLDGAVRTASAAGYAGEGMVKIGVVASVSSSFPNRLIRAFKADFPNVTLDIVEGSYGEHLAALMERTLDVAFVMDSPKPPGCEVEGLWSEPILAALPADDPRCARGVLDIQEMAADLFIVSQAAPGPHVHDFIVQRLASLGFTPRINQHRVGREGLMAMVGLGFGLSVICGSGGERDLPRRDLRPAGRRSAAVQRDLVPGQRQSGPQALSERSEGSVSEGICRRRRATANARSVAMNRSSIGAMSLTGSTAAPVSRARASA